MILHKALHPSDEVNRINAKKKQHLNIKKKTARIDKYKYKSSAYVTKVVNNVS